jgi:hypothetical protein
MDSKRRKKPGSGFETLHSLERVDLNTTDQETLN